MRSFKECFCLVLSGYLLICFSTASPTPAISGLQEDPWIAPFALRVASNNTALNNQLVTRIVFGTDTDAYGVQINASLSAASSLASIYPIYPSRDAFATAAELFEKQYHSSTNTSELIQYWGSKPETASNTPLLQLNVDRGPGITHVWPAGTTVVTWGAWHFVKDDQARVWLRFLGQDDGAWRWIAWEDEPHVWTLGRWNGTTPATGTGWSNSFYDILENHVDIDLEVLPVSSLGSGNSSMNSR